MVRLAPHLDQGAEPERLGAVLHDHGDLLHSPSLHQVWQKINGLWHSCHSWQDCDRRMITAMTYLMILLLIVAAMSVASIRMLVRDGRGPQRPPVSHWDDARFRAPLAH